MSGWLSARQNASDVERLLRGMLTGQREFLSEKLARSQEVHTALAGLAKSNSPAFQAVFDERKHDEALVGQITDLLDNDSSSTGNEALRWLEMGFLEAQGLQGLTELSDRQIDARLARYLVSDLEAEYDTARGILLDMERQASRLLSMQLITDPPPASVA